MVPRQEERRKTPKYPLEEIHRLAKAEKVNYGGRKVQSDITNLNYDLRDVCRCLLSLNACHFKESIEYVDSGICFDVYRVTCRGQEEVDDPLYLKLKVSRDSIVVLGSFHR